MSKFELYQGKLVETTAPFDEFDAYPMIIPHCHGFAYNLLFSHRYERWTVNLGKIIGSFTSEGAIKSGWEFLQNYMDVSRPLPDNLALQAYRHLDPVTAAYDQATGRNPRKLRDMPEKQLMELAMERGNPYGTIMNQRPCLFAEGGYVTYLSSCECHLEPLEEH